MQSLPLPPNSVPLPPIVGRPFPDAVDGGNGVPIARLRHPNVVQVYEVGQHDGQPYFSLEYCEESTLAEKLAGTSLPPEDAARLLRTIAEAVHAAHLAGVVHRDLKPANVLLQ